MRLKQIAGLLLSVSSAAGAVAQHRYTVETDTTLDELRIEACFADPRPTALVAGGERADAYLRRVSWSDGSRVTVRGERIDLQETRSACINYSVDLVQATDSLPGHRRRYRGPDKLLNVGDWLWRPARLGRDDALSVTFRMPPTISVSTPWQPDPQKPGSFLVGTTPYGWTARVAIGRLQTDVIDVPGAKLHVTLLNSAPGPDRAAIGDWIKQNAMAVTTLYGRFPLSSVQIIVAPVPNTGQGSPVPWGEVARGGLPAVFLVVNPGASAAQLMADWTAAHEFSHLLLPYISRSQAWLSEGFGSYYQNVLRGRAGLLTEQQVWQNLHDGFNRGRSATNATPLSVATRHMRRDATYMRVYWSGVAMLLMADVEYRLQSDGRHSLDTALAALRDCCLPAPRSWDGKALARRLDNYTNTSALADLIETYEQSTEFPDLDELFQLLGILVKAQRITLTDDAPLAEIRRAILRPASDRHPVSTQ